MVAARFEASRRSTYSRHYCTNRTKPEERGVSRLRECDCSIPVMCLASNPMCLNSRMSKRWSLENHLKFFTTIIQGAIRDSSLRITFGQPEFVADLFRTGLSVPKRPRSRSTHSCWIVEIVQNHGCLLLLLLVTDDDDAIIRLDYREIVREHIYFSPAAKFRWTSVLVRSFVLFFF